MRSSRSIALVIAVLSLTVQVTLARVAVKIDFDKSFDFKAARTWGWKPEGPGEVKMARSAADDSAEMEMTRNVEPIIVDAVTSEMARRGLQQAPSEPDVFVTYYLLLTTNMQAHTMGQFLPPTLEWGLPPFPQATQSFRILNQGALVLDVSAKGAVVWRGVAQAQIKMDAEWKKREALVRAAVKDLLRRYPPKR